MHIECTDSHTSTIVHTCTYHTHTYTHSNHRIGTVETLENTGKWEPTEI